ncbi:MAG: hypothetical protein ACKO5F_12285 [Synechococcus sp.]
MVFKRKPAFFLELGGESQAAKAEPAKVVVAPVSETSAQEKPAALKKEEAPATAAPAATAAAPSGEATLTTAEAIAAELAAAAASRPAPSLATFAPNCLVPGAAVPSRRRRGGANLAGFRDMAAGMFRN